MKLFKSLRIKEPDGRRRKIDWPEGTTERGLANDLNQLVRFGGGNNIPPETGYVVEDTHKSVGCSEVIGRRTSPASGGQQDAVLIRCLKNFPKKAEEVKGYFIYRVQETNKSLKTDHPEVVAKAGAALITGVVDTRTDTIWSSNLGDSTLLLVTEDPETGEFKIEQLNSLHKPDNPAEEKRILEAGGSIGYAEDYYNQIDTCLKKLIENRDRGIYTLDKDLFSNIIKEYDNSDYRRGVLSILHELKYNSEQETSNRLIKFSTNFLAERACKRIISQEDGWGRVNKLSVSGGLGDEHCPAMLRDPEIKSRAIPKGRSWLLTACDGLTEKLSLERIKNIVQSLVKKGCDLHLMSSFPDKDTKAYRNSYILVGKRLRYITFSGEYEKSDVPIKDIGKFLKDIKSVTPSGQKIELSLDQVEKLITSNGGHTPDPESSAWRIALALTDAAIKAKTADNVSVIVSSLHRLPKNEDEVYEFSVLDGHGENAHLLAHTACDKLKEDFIPSPEQEKLQLPKAKPVEPQPTPGVSSAVPPIVAKPEPVKNVSTHGSKPETSSVPPSQTNWTPAMFTKPQSVPIVEPHFPKLLNKINTYRGNRSQEEMYTDNCYKMFGFSFGYSKTDKMEATGKLIQLLERKKLSSPFSPKEIRVLFQGKLSDDTKPYKKQIENLIAEYNQKETPRLGRY